MKLSNRLLHYPEKSGSPGISICFHQPRPKSKFCQIRPELGSRIRRPSPQSIFCKTLKLSIYTFTQSVKLVFEITYMLNCKINRTVQIFSSLKVISEPRWPASRFCLLPVWLYPLYFHVIINLGHIWAPFMAKIDKMCQKIHCVPSRLRILISPYDIAYIVNMVYIC